VFADSEVLFFVTLIVISPSKTKKTPKNQTGVRNNATDIVYAAVSVWTEANGTKASRVHTIDYSTAQQLATRNCKTERGDRNSV